MNELIQQIKWQFTLLHRNNFITISIVVTAMYAIIFFAIRDLGNTDKVLTLLILNDLAIIGLFFIGLSVITEKDQQVLTALFVTPMSHHIYLLSRVLSLSIIGWGVHWVWALRLLAHRFISFIFLPGFLGYACSPAWQVHGWSVIHRSLCVLC